MSQNVFLKNLNPDYRQDLIKVREGQAFAEGLMRQMQHLYQFRVNYERNREMESEYQIDPHQYGIYVGGFLKVSPQGVEFSSYVRYPDMQGLFNEKVQTCVTGWTDRADMDKQKAELDAKINAIGLKMGFTVKRHADSACGDKFRLVCMLADDDTLGDKVKVIMRIFQAKGIKMKLEAV